MLTITVYRVRPDGTRTPPLSRTLVPDTVRDPTDALPFNTAFPPCRCLRCHRGCPRTGNR